MTQKEAASKQSILLIDNDKLVLNSLQIVFKKYGYQVTCAISGPAGIEWAKQSKFDLIISDIKMPGMNGIETVEHIKEIYRQRDIQAAYMFITGYADLETSQKAAALGIAEFMLKPFDVEQFMDSVAREISLNQINIAKSQKRSEVIPKDSMVGKWQFPKNAFELTKIVLLKQTNLMGNTYFANYVEWQGEARESLLVSHPSVKEWLTANAHIKMITHSLNHRFFVETTFGDAVKITVTVRELKHCSFLLQFKYNRVSDQAFLGEGWQKVCFHDMKSGKLCPVPRLVLDLIEPIQETA